MTEWYKPLLKSSNDQTVPNETFTENNKTSNVSILKTDLAEDNKKDFCSNTTDFKMYKTNNENELKYVQQSNFILYIL